MKGENKQTNKQAKKKHFFLCFADRASQYIYLSN